MPRPLPLSKLTECCDNSMEIKKAFIEGMTKADILDLYDITLHQLNSLINEIKKEGKYKRRNGYGICKTTI